MIDGFVGEVNLYDFDANVALVAANDQIWFTLKHSKLDDDTAAVLIKGLNVPTKSGISVVSEAQGTFRVTLNKTDLEGLGVRALLYDCKVKKADTGIIQTVRSGVLLLADGVNGTAA